MILFSFWFNFFYEARSSAMVPTHSNRRVRSLYFCPEEQGDPMDRESAVGIATGYGLRVPVGLRILTSTRRPDRLWGPPNLLSNGYRRLSGRGES
jgi:hypothetical protein